MARVKLQLPESFIFSTELEVRITDINYGGHLANEALQGFLQEARCRFLHENNYSEFDVEGVGLIMSDAVIIYKSEAFFPERLRVDLAIADFSGHGCDFFYRVLHTADKREVARAKTGIVFFDYKEKKIKPVPNSFKRKFAPECVEASLSELD